MKIEIEINDDGYCDVKIIDKKITSHLSSNTPMQLLGLLFGEIVVKNIELKKKIDNWIIRIGEDHAEIIDELLYDKFVEVAEFATRVKKSFYK